MSERTDRTTRAGLKPYFHHGKWQARGYVPIRAGDRITRKEVERSTGASTRAQAQRVCDQLNAMFEERALSSRRTLTFAQAYENYVNTKHPDPKFGEKLLLHFGTTLVSEIDNTSLVEAAKALFPEDAKAAYLNRHLYTPVIAILRLASRDGACSRPDFKRPRGYSKHPPVKAPEDDSWFTAIWPHLSIDARAMLSVLTIHGRRVGEAAKCGPEAFVPGRGLLDLGYTKNGKHVVLQLHPGIVELMQQMPGWRYRDYLFGFVPSPHGGCDAFNYALREACAKAGVPYFSAHKAGRHRFALRLLDQGRSLQFVKDAGGWDTIGVVSDRYGARAMAEHTPQIHDAGTSVIDAVTKNPGKDPG